jgi:hypothetical protein
MPEVIAILLGALIGSAFSLLTAFFFVGAVRHLGQGVFLSWRRWLFLPVVVLFALSQTAPMFFPFYAFGFVHASFPLGAALLTLAMVCGVSALIPPLMYFIRQRRHLEEAGYLRPRRV